MLTLMSGVEERKMHQCKVIQLRGMQHLSQERNETILPALHAFLAVQGLVPCAVGVGCSPNRILLVHRPSMVDDEVVFDSLALWNVSFEEVCEGFFTLLRRAGIVAVMKQDNTFFQAISGDCFQWTELQGRDIPMVTANNIRDFLQVQYDEYFNVQ